MNRQGAVLHFFALDLPGVLQEIHFYGHGGAGLDIGQLGCIQGILPTLGGKILDRGFSFTVFIGILHRRRSFIAYSDSAHHEFIFRVSGGVAPLQELAVAGLGNLNGIGKAIHIRFPCGRGGGGGTGLNGGAFREIDRHADGGAVLCQDVGAVPVQDQLIFSFRVGRQRHLALRAAPVEIGHDDALHFFTRVRRGGKRDLVIIGGGFHLAVADRA